MHTLLALLALSAVADEKLAGKACRSVHLGYTAPAGRTFYTELTVEQSAPGTYFCACGFAGGYFGIQELANGKKLVIFSVWDPTAGDDPKAVPADKRVTLLHKADGVRTGRFGNEGTGGQSFYNFDWQVGTAYRFAVTAKPDGPGRTAYAGHFYHPGQKKWLHLVTFGTPDGRQKLGGYYSFVEDFRRNGESLKKVRKAVYANGWVKTDKDEWQPLTAARFTGDGNPSLAIDAGPVESGFFLATGGDTTNATTKLKETMTRAKPMAPPADVPD